MDENFVYAYSEGAILRRNPETMEIFAYAGDGEWKRYQNTWDWIHTAQPIKPENVEKALAMFDEQSAERAGNAG